MVVPLGRSGADVEVEGLDAVVNLAGAGLADRRWTRVRKQELRDSRVRTTEGLARAIVHARRPPRVLLSGSAIGFYGDRGELQLDEAGTRGPGFLAELAAAWEGATQVVEAAGIRVVHLRTGVVLSPQGGALAKLLLPFRLGLGGGSARAHRSSAGSPWRTWWARSTSRSGRRGWPAR